MHGRSCMTIDPGVPTLPARSTSGFTDQADIACTKREAPVRCSAGRMKGKMHSTINKNRFLRRTFLNMNDSVE